VVNVICIKWGDKYPALYVNKLYGMVQRHLKREHRFVCFTHDPRGDVRPEVELMPYPAIALPHKQRDYPWRKVSLFARPLGDLAGPTLFLDLDTLITGPLDDFFDYRPGAFCVAENWTTPGTGIGNTSVYRFEAGAYPDLYETFVRDPAAVIGAYDNSQTFITRYLGDRVHFWPAQWVRSFKVNCIPHFLLRPFVAPKLPSGARIIAFPGNPKMPDAIEGRWPGGPHKFVRKTPWIADFWQE
jgi:hypothetical protein